MPFNIRIRLYNRYFKTILTDIITKSNTIILKEDIKQCLSGLPERFSADKKFKWLDMGEDEGIVADAKSRVKY